MDPASPDPVQAEALAAEQKLQEEREVLETINRIGRILSAELDLQRLVQAVTDAATELTGAQFGSFFYNVLTEEGGSYTLYTLSGVPREAFANFPMPRATALFGPTFRGEAPVRIDDVRKDPRFGANPPYHGMPAGHLPVTSYLAVPVISRSGEVLGGLFFGHSAAGVFTERHVRIVEGLAAQTAIAMDNARLYESAQRALQERESLLASERAARHEAEVASRAKDEFLGLLSHELRNPLNAMLGWTRILASRQLDDATFARAVDTIDRNAKLQARLIDDMLDVSRIVSGKLRLDAQPVDLTTVIHAAVDTSRPAADAKNIRLQMVLDFGSGTILGDPMRLQQVIWNLLSNAIKFTPKNGRVQIQLERVNSHIEVTVSDTGPGIDPDFLPFVFDRFRQADSSESKRHGGLGLGLSIVRHLVEMHGGTVEAGNHTEQQGAVFVVKLPLMVLRAQGAPAEQRRVHPAASGAVPFDSPPETPGPQSPGGGRRGGCPPAHRPGAGAVRGRGQVLHLGGGGAGRPRRVRAGHPDLRHRHARGGRLHPDQEGPGTGGGTRPAAPRPGPDGLRPRRRPPAGAQGGLQHAHPQARRAGGAGRRHRQPRGPETGTGVGLDPADVRPRGH